MSEIVYTETLKRRGDVANLDDMYQSRIPTDTKWTLFQSREKVALVSANLIVGRPRSNRVDTKGKRYYYWRSVNSFGFRRNKAGNVMAYECHRPWESTGIVSHWRHRQPRTPFQMLEGFESDDYAFSDYSDAMFAAFKRAVWESFGITKTTDLFPLMEEYGLINYWSIPNNLKMGFREDSVSAMTECAFGKKRTTDRLVAAVANTEPYITSYAHQFRGLVPDEKIVEFIENNHFDEDMEEGFRPHTPTLRHGLLKYPIVAHSLIENEMDLADSRRVAALSRMNKDSVEHYFHTAAKNCSKTLSDFVYTY